MSSTAATVTGDWPTIAQVGNGQLTAQLAAKQATLGFQGATTTALPGSLLTSDNATVTLGSSTKQLVIHSTPALEHIPSITFAAQNASFGRPTISVLANDPGAGTEAAVQYYMTSTMAHQLSASVSTSSNTSNYLRWYIRNTNETLQNAMQIKADKGMNVHSNLHLAGLMYGNHGTFTSVLTIAGLRIGSSGTTMPLDVDNGAAIQNEKSQLEFGRDRN